MFTIALFGPNVLQLHLSCIKKLVTILYECCHISMDLLNGRVWYHKFVNVVDIKCQQSKQIYFCDLN